MKISEDYGDFFKKNQANRPQAPDNYPRLWKVEHNVKILKQLSRIYIRQ